jgi:hypothetical protein
MKMETLLKSAYWTAAKGYNLKWESTHFAMTLITASAKYLT